MQANRETTDARKLEHAKYDQTYLDPNYRMGDARKTDAIQDIQKFFSEHDAGNFLTMLDVGCGRGEMLEIGREIGFEKCDGIEVVAYLIDNVDVQYGEIYSLPISSNQYDLVTCFDVLEHIHRTDTEAALGELIRVASRAVILTANNRPSFATNGADLHINKMPYPEWDALIKACAEGKGTVTWVKDDRHYVSETWRIDIDD